MSQLYEVLWVLISVVDRLSVVTDATTEGQSFINDGQVALEHRLTHVFSDPIRVVPVDCIVVQGVLEVKEADSSEDVDDDHCKKACCQQLICV